jgi:hypothetical protein
MKHSKSVVPTTRLLHVVDFIAIMMIKVGVKNSKKSGI